MDALSVDTYICDPTKAVLIVLARSGVGWIQKFVAGTMAKHSPACSPTAHTLSCIRRPCAPLGLLGRSFWPIPDDSLMLGSPEWCATRLGKLRDSGGPNELLTLSKMCLMPCIRRFVFLFCSSEPKLPPIDSTAACNHSQARSPHELFRG